MATRIISGQSQALNPDALGDLYDALLPFAACCDQIDAGEDDEEWAKFRLLIKDYRRAGAAVAKAGGERA